MRDLGIIIFTKNHLSPCFINNSSLSPSDWSNKEQVAYHRAGEERRDFRVEIGTLGKNQANAVCRPDTEEETGAGTDRELTGHLADIDGNKWVIGYRS